MTFKGIHWFKESEQPSESTNRQKSADEYPFALEEIPIHSLHPVLKLCGFIFAFIATVVAFASVTLGLLDVISFAVATARVEPGSIHAAVWTALSVWVVTAALIWSVLIASAWSKNMLGPQKLLENPRISTIHPATTVEKYVIVIEGSGMVYDGDDESEARLRFKQFVKLSKDQRTITLLRNGQILRQYSPDDDPPLS